MVESGVNPGKFEPISGEQRANLIRSYGNLYSQSRVETLEYLDKLEELRGADELKSKLLFSVIVVSSVCLLAGRGPRLLASLSRYAKQTVGVPLAASHVGPDEGSREAHPADPARFDAGSRECVHFALAAAAPAAALRAVRPSASGAHSVAPGRRQAQRPQSRSRGRAGRRLLLAPIGRHVRPDEKH